MKKSNASDTPRVNSESQGGVQLALEFLKTRKFGVLTIGGILIVGAAIVFSGSPEELLEPTGPSGTLGQMPQKGNAVALEEYRDAPEVVPPEKEEKEISVTSQPGIAAAGEVPAEKPKLPGPGLLVRPKDFSVIPGSLVRAILLTGASNGPVKASLGDALTLNGETLLEAGTVLLGTGQSSEERLYIRFNRVVFKDGVTQQLQADAADFSDKIPGLKGSRVGARAAKIAGSIGLDFASGLTEGLQQKEVKGGVVLNQTSLKNALLNGTSRTALDQSREMLSSMKNDAPIIEVSEETEFYVLFGKDGM